MFIDTHTHLFAKPFNDDIETVIKQSVEAGINEFYLPNVDLNSVERMYYLCDTYKECRAMIGLHPCSVKEDYEAVLDKLEAELKGERKIWGIGETGLDFHWDMTFVDNQKKALRRQIEWAKEHEIPIILHTRESFDATYEIISEMNDERLTGIFHCFTGNLEEAQKVIDLGGFYMGIGGVVTFKNAGVDKHVAEIPMEHLVLETDAPYLAPTPHRGKRNESTFIPLIAQKIAEIKGISIEEVGAITTENAQKIFG